jgi:hypothetical protein
MRTADQAWPKKDQRNGIPVNSLVGQSPRKTLIISCSSGNIELVNHPCIFAAKVFNRHLRDAAPHPTTQCSAQVASHLAQCPNPGLVWYTSTNTTHSSSRRRNYTYQIRHRHPDPRPPDPPPSYSSSPCNASFTTSRLSLSNLLRWTTLPRHLSTAAVQTRTTLLCRSTTTASNSGSRTRRHDTILSKPTVRSKSISILAVLLRPRPNRAFWC